MGVAVLKGIVTGIVALGALAVCAVDAQAATVNLQFNLNNAGPGSIGVVNQIQETQSGITWTATGQRFLGGVWTDARVSQVNPTGLGVVNLGNADDNGVNGQTAPERLGLLFAPTVTIDNITFTLVDHGSQGPGDGDEFILFYNGGQTAATALTSVTHVGDITVMFDLTTIPGLTAAQRTGGQFYIGTSGFAASPDGDDDFRIAGATITVGAVPLPPAAWAGLAMLGAMAVAAGVRRRKSEVA